MLDFLKKRPMLSCALVSSVISVISFYSETALFILALVLLGSLFYFVYKRIKGEHIFALCLVLVVAVSGFLTADKANKFKDYDKSNCEGVFIVTETPQNHGEYYSVTLETVECDLLGSGEKIYVSYSNTQLEFSQRIKAEISLFAAEEPAKPIMDYSNGIFIRGSIEKVAAVRQKDGVLSVVNNLRKHIKNTIFENYAPGTAATVMALVAGDRGYLSEEFYSNVKQAGVAHVLVVSGMHLSIIVSLFLYLCNKVFYNRYLKALTILFATLTVMAVCGFTMSIQRAGITYLLVALGLLLDRENSPENTLGLAVTIVLLTNPFAVFNIAFLLSVLSTFSIIVVSVPVTEFIADKGIIKSKALLSVVSSAIISISALIFTAPVTICVFGYLSTVSVITNLLIATPASLIMIFCILGFLLPFLSVPLFAISEAVTYYVNAVINFFGGWKYSIVFTPLWMVILFIIIIIMILWALVACKVKLDMLKLRELCAKKEKEGGKGLNGNNFGAGIEKRSKKR